MKLNYKELSDNDYGSIKKLCHDVFMEYEAPLYSQEGIDTFLYFLNSDEFRQYIADKDKLFYGCFDENTLIGVIGMRNESHITVCFVDSNYQRMGIGRKLMTILIDSSVKNNIPFITVNSSPYGLPFYKSIGFNATDKELSEDGIIYTPMKITLDT